MNERKCNACKHHPALWSPDLEGCNALQLVWWRLCGAKETIVKSYVVPKLGLRVFPFRKIFYADASFGWSFNLSGTDTKTLGQTLYNASPGGFIYFLQVGARFNLKNDG